MRLAELFHNHYDIGLIKQCPYKTAIFQALVNGACRFNPEGEKVIGHFAAENFLLSEFESCFRSLISGNVDAAAIPRMFQAMHNIYNAKTGEDTSAYYEMAAPIYAISLLSNGYILPRSLLVDATASEAALLARTPNEKITVLDVACGVGLQSQRLAQILENKNLRDKVEIIGVDPSPASLQIAAGRTTRAGVKVYDSTYCSSAQDIPHSPELTGKNFDIMLSVGAIGGYITPPDFGKMLKHPGFTETTKYCFSIRKQPAEQFLRHISLPAESIVTVTQNGYERTLYDSAGNELDRNYTMVTANCRMSYTAIGMKR